MSDQLGEWGCSERTYGDETHEEPEDALRARVDEVVHDELGGVGGRHGWTSDGRGGVCNKKKGKEKGEEEKGCRAKRTRGAASLNVVDPLGGGTGNAQPGAREAAGPVGEKVLPHGTSHPVSSGGRLEE